VSADANRGAGIRILIIDDDPGIRSNLGGFLGNRGYSVRTAGTAAEALESLEDGSVRIVLLDLRMPDVDGIELGRTILQRYPGLVILILTAYSTIETAVRAMRYGIYDYLPKPVEPDELLLRLDRVVERLQLTSEVADLRDRLQDRAAEGLIGRTPGMRRVRELAATAARSDLAVLVYGETGTGKELVARAIHDQSDCRAGPFVALNCAAIPETLIESELFGHVRGAFTGALRARPGRIASAAGGTLFLDEIGAAPLALQAKLLRALQERVYYPVGSDKEEKHSVRIVAAVNQEPRELVAAGRLREDLYYRIGMFRIDVPPLRERLPDIPLLADALLERAARRQGRIPPRVAPDLIAAFYAHAWPGNVRELENVLSTMLALEKGELLTPAALPPDYRRLATGAPAAETDRPRSLAAALQGFERHIISETLRRHEGRLRVAAVELGIDERSLRRKLKRFGLDRKSFKVKADGAGGADGAGS
jgi:two-component system NtrC family response regulator